MSGVAIEITVEGYPVLQKKLGGLAARTSHMRPLMEDIGAYLDFSTRQRFITQRAPDGTPWAQSARAIAEGGKTLIDTARLMQSYSYQAQDFSVEEGTNVVYAGIFQFSGKIRHKARTQTIYRKYDAKSDMLGHRFVKRSKSNFASDHQVGEYEVDVTARPMLGVNDNDEKEITHIVDAYLMRGIQ